MLSLAAGYQSVVADSGIEKTDLSEDNPEDADELNKYSEALEAYGEGDKSKMESLSGYYELDPDSSMGHAKVTHYDKFSTALGYQATADEPGTIAFGHDAGDESGYTYEWETLTDENGNPKQNEIDGTTNDYTKAPKSVKKKAPYTSAYYNRLVKVADGIDDHDVVVMEQLKQYAEKDASNIGNNIKVYKTDANGNVQLDKDKKPIEETDATTTAQNGSKDAWGKALGAGTFTTGTDTTPTNASISDQLVTGKTLYDYDKPTGTQNYVKANNTTGQNLSALDAQVAANTSTLNDKTHNIKYYSVDETILPKINGYSNEDNDGAKGMGSIAAGFNTHADGIASTVAGSYSGVINQNSAGLYDLRGATALSYGTFNINQNTDTGKIFSGVANSIVGQANATTDSNAAIIYGAGNTVTNSYRKIDDTNASEIMKAALSKDVKKLDEALQKAVPTSGGQVMVMGGGNNVESAYMTQVVGVGNTVKGNQVYTKDAKTGKWNWTTDTNDETAIEDYDPKKSSQYNYVDGFSNEVINGKHDYVIGANNTVTGDSYDDKDAKKYSNESNIIFGDNHTVTNTKNAVIIGSSDTQMTLDQGDRATAIGHNASAQRDALAVGVNTEARGNAVALGTYSTAHNNSIAIGTKATAVSSQNLAIGWEAHIGNIKTDDEKIKNAIALGSDSQVKVNDLLESDNNRGVLSIGDKDKERRIIHVRAGVNDTDAVNVSQLKSVQSGLTDKGLTFVTNDGERTAKLGSKVTIQGTAKKDGHEYTADNLTTEIDKDGNITILMDKDMSVEKLAVNGKDGTEGHIGLTGPAGTKGKDGTNAIDITVKNGYDGANGVNGKNGVDGTSLTRIVYTDKTGEHQVATMEDGLKFKGDDTTVIAKKLNNTMEIIGGADSKNLTEGNIGVNSTDKGQLKVQLAKDLKGITSISNQTTTSEGESQTTTGAKITLGSDGNVDVNGGKVTNVNSALDGAKDAEGKDATIATATGDALKNAANLGDLQKVYKEVNAKADKVSASHTALTVEGGTSAGTQDEKTKQDVYAGKNILLHESTDENGKVTYDLKLAKDINIGKPGKDGEDGQIGIDGRDGHIGLNGSDGISVRGLDGKDGAPGKDGVTITGPKGEAGKDGINGKVGISGKDGNDAVSISGKDGVGHIGLTGPAGTNGKDGTNAIDITVKNGYDGANGVNGKNGVDGTSLTRIVYTDKTGEHQVATMEDGLKFKGDDTTVIAKKLNNTMEIIGGADSKNLTEGNIGVNSTDKGQLKVQLAKDLTGITSISNQTTTKDGDKDVTTGAKITLGTDGATTITGGDVNVGGNKVTNIKSALDGAKDAKGNTATIATATGDDLKNAANLGDLQKVYNDINAKADKASASHTALTVEGGTAAGKDDEKNKGVYAGKNILLHESTDENGKVTYDLKLAKDITIGKPGKDGEDGKIGIDGKDGHIGLNGSDGITVRGLDGKDGAPGKDGVTITGPKGEAGKDGIDGKVGISGKDGNDAVSISGKDGVGHIGLTGPAGTNGKDGTNAIDITVKNGYDGANGVNGKNGVDGTSLTRIVYTDKTGEHQVATMEDGLKFKGDDTTVIAKKLNNTMEIIGGADSKNLTEGNIGVNSTDKGQLKVQLAKDLTGITSISNQKTTKVEGKDVTTGAKIDLGEDGSVNVNGGKITNVGSGIEKDGNGKYTVTDQNKYNAANVGDVQNIVNDAKKDLTEGANGLNKKANVDASNIGTNLKNADGSAASTDAQKANAEKWGSAIGTGEIKADDGRMVTGETVYDEVRPTADGSYVKKDKTTGENLSALDTKIGSLDKDGNYIKKDDSISNNLSTLDTQVKTNADAIKKNSDDITNINKSISSLDQNAVKYDDTTKGKVTLAGGEGGTTITNVKDGTLSDSSKDAVNGKQLYNEQQAREAADNAITEKVTNNTNEITKIKNGDFTDASKTAIHNIAKDAVAVVNGKNTTVTKVEGTDTTPTTYAVNVEGTGKVAAGDTGLISGDTLYKEVHIDKDGAYIKGSQSVGQSLSNLDTGLKTTSDLIHTNAKGDTIQIGGNSTATKIDISGKDKDGKSTGRVITGVVSDVNDPNSAANVGYVNGITAASNEQIYHDMNMQYNHVENDISRAAAGSNALAALHPMQEFDPDDKAQFALGYGHYRNSNAGAVGAFYQPDENSMVNFGVSFGNGDAGINAGVTFKFGPGGSGHHALTKTQMAKVIDAQSKEIDELKKDNADKDKRIDALEQKMTEILAKLDKSKD